MAWIKSEETYDRWSLRAVFAGAVAGIAGVTALGISTFAAPVIAPIAAVTLAAGVALEAGAIAHSFFRPALAAAKDKGERWSLRATFGGAATVLATYGGWMTTAYVAPAASIALTPVAGPLMMVGMAIMAGGPMIQMYSATRPAPPRSTGS